MFQRGIVGRVGDEHGLAVLNRAFQLGIALEVHHVIADRRVFIRRDQPHRLAAPLREKDGAAIQSERFTQLARDGLQDVDEMQRSRDLLQDLDDREQVLALVLELGDARREAFAFGGGESGRDGHGEVCPAFGMRVKRRCRVPPRALASDP